MHPCHPVATMGFGDEATPIDQPALVLTDTGSVPYRFRCAGTITPWPHGMAHGIRPGPGSPDAGGAQLSRWLLSVLAVEEGWATVEVPDGLSPCPMNLFGYGAGRPQGNWFETILPSVGQTSLPILDQP